MNYLIVPLVLLLSLVALGRAGGITNFHCPTQGNASVVIGCVMDCQQQHGADTGTCGDVSQGDHNCYCDGRPGNVAQRSTLQCKEINDGYRNLCTFDCVCNHGADGGHCSWDMGLCYCENYGKNRNNKGCPARSTEEYKAIARGFLAPKK